MPSFGINLIGLFGTKRKFLWKMKNYLKSTKLAEQLLTIINKYHYQKMNLSHYFIKFCYLFASGLSALMIKKFYVAISYFFSFRERAYIEIPNNSAARVLTLLLSFRAIKISFFSFSIKFNNCG